MGWAFDMSCVLWQYDECGERGSCLIYDNKELALLLFIMCFSIKALSLVAMVLALVVYKPPATVEPLVKDVPDPAGQLAVVSFSEATEKPHSMHNQIEDTPNGYDNIPMTPVVAFAAKETNEASEDLNIHL